MDKTFVLFFRSINVGGKNSLPMKGLTAVLEKLGYGDIKTYIQSGNVVCKGKPVPDTTLSLAIKKKFGFEPGFITLTPQALKTAIKNNPFSKFEGKAVHFFFCSDKPKASTIKLLQGYKADSEEIHLAGKVLYLHAP